MPAAIFSSLLASSTLLVLAQNPRMDHRVGPEAFTLRVLATGLGNPWEVAWGPDNFLWVTERTAYQVTRINPTDGSKHVAIRLTDVHQTVEQDGLLGLALHPNLLRGTGADYVYLASTYDRDPGPGVTRRLRVRRYTYDRGRQALTFSTDVLDDLPSHDDHVGGRLIIGPGEKLYISIGDLGSNFLANYCNPNHAQTLPTAAQVNARDWTSYQGKILRMNLDGSIPADNPVLAGVRSHVFTYGHRNAQGLDFTPGGAFYASEHGPGTDDEVNRIVAGKNYGWPNVAGFKDDRAYAYANWSRSAPTPCRELKFDGIRAPASVPELRETAWSHDDFAAPLATLFTVPADYDFRALGNATVAPAGIAVYAASAIPNWATSILVTGMRTGAVYRFKLDAPGTAVMGTPLEYFTATDRYRDIALHPDGRRLYLSTDSHGSTMDASGGRTEKLSHPGAVIEFTYAGSAARLDEARPPRAQAPPSRTSDWLQPRETR
ncbi:MAG: glucose/sorbosone family PQQ-dependent dehydrogenase [Acidobacteriota bacterium]